MIKKKGLDKELKEGIENSDDEVIKEIAADIGKYSDLEALYLTEGGQMLVQGNLDDVMSCINTLSLKYHSLTQSEFIALCAEMKTKLDLVQALAHSPKNKADAVEALRDKLKGEESS